MGKTYKDMLKNSEGEYTKNKKKIKGKLIRLTWENIDDYFLERESLREKIDNKIEEVLDSKWPE